MEFANVTAIIRNEMIQNVELALEKAGIGGFTVTEVKGVGEWEKRFSFFAGPTKHCRIDILIEEKLAEQIAGVIMEAAHTGSVGDGLVAVLPVSKVFRIRTKGPLMP
jgi:nitrogen regulatory protein P-II 1